MCGGATCLSVAVLLSCERGQRQWAGSDHVGPLLNRVIMTRRADVRAMRERAGLG